MKIKLLLFCICFASANMAFGQYDYFKDQLAKAEAGDVMGMLYVANHYRYGSDKDYKKAVEWFEKAANKGNVAAMLDMAYAYEDGKGVTQDYKKAVYWYDKAARLDDSGQGKWRLGRMYQQGLGVEKDYEEAVKWYKKSAELGHRAGQNALGNMYAAGCGVPKDYVEAAKWYQKAADGKSVRGMTNLGDLYLSGLGVSQSDDEAIRWYRKAIDEDDPAGIAQYRLGAMYTLGRGVVKNDAEAFKWFLESAEKGCVDGQDAVAYSYNLGRGIGQNYTEAVKWYRKAISQGSMSSQNNLGVMYEKGYGVEKNYSEAIRLYLNAAESGIARAQYHLGYMYENGYGVLQNEMEAITWYRKAAEQGDTDSQERLSILGQVATSNVQSQQQQSQPQAPVLTAKVPNVDSNIPINKNGNRNTFAIILGNEKYEDEANVPYAENDAKIFKEYCRQTLGISENHIRFVSNAGYNDMRKAVNWLRQGIEAYNGEGNVIFYYAGHGIPDEAEKTAYLLPADGIGSDVGSAYSLAKLYQTLGEMPAKSIVIFLDACFSGAKRDGGMMASARGIAIKTKTEEPKGKMVVFTAAQSDETAYPYKSQQHGMFTYYLLRKLQETKGDVTLGELADYITREVKRQSFDENNRSQTPSIKASESIEESWRNMKLK